MISFRVLKVATSTTALFLGSRLSITPVLQLGIQQPFKSLYANMRWQQDSILKQAPFGMASVLDSVTPPSTELGGESIRVHDEFFGHVNVKSVLRFFPQRAGFPLCLFHLGTPLRNISGESLL